MNKKEQIEKQLKNWFNQMLVKYTWLKIKYEYNDAKECFLVSFYTSSNLEYPDSFDKEVLMFEEDMDNQYGDYSPLFCDNETLFKLSSNAKVAHTQTANFTEVHNETFVKMKKIDLSVVMSDFHQYCAGEVNPGESHYCDELELKIAA